MIRAITTFRTRILQQLRKRNTPLSYTTARQTFLVTVVKLDLHREDFGLHSLRSGGASAAANAGVLDRLLTRHGWWKSDTVQDDYV